MVAGKLICRKISLNSNIFVLQPYVQVIKVRWEGMAEWLSCGNHIRHGWTTWVQIRRKPPGFFGHRRVA